MISQDRRKSDKAETTNSLCLSGPKIKREGLDRGSSLSLSLIVPFALGAEQYDRIRKLGSPVVPFLVKALRVVESDVRMHAVNALTLLADVPEVEPALKAALESASPRMRVYAAYTLAEIGSDSAISALISVMNDHRTHKVLRGVAARKLGEAGRGSDEALQALTKAVGDSQSSVRLFAAQSFSKLGPEKKKSVPALIEMLKNGSNRHIRASAAMALGCIGPCASGAVPTLVEVLKKELLTKETTALRVNVITALGQIGRRAREAVPVLVEALEGDYFSYTPAVFALGRIGPQAKGAVPALSQLLERDLFMKDEVAEAVSRIDSSKGG